MSPSAVLVINNGTSRIVNIKNQDTVTKIIDMVPDLVNKFSSMAKKGSESESSDLSDEEVIDAVTSSENN